MPEFTKFKLPSGAILHVQSSLRPPGVAQASGVGEKARETWNDGLALVREVAEGVVAELREATKQAEAVMVGFGVNISGKSGIILVEGEAAAHLKVTLSWKAAG